MASPISPPTPFTSPAIFSDSNLNFHSCTTFSFNSPFLRKPNLIPSISISKPQNSSFCCCRSSSSDSPSPSPSPSSLLQQFLVAAAQAVEDFVNSRFSPKKDEVVVREKKSEEGGNLEVDVDGWDWERWSLHFKEVEEQERLINLLKSQLRHAIEKEDYEVAARLKVAIAAAGTKDAVGSVMCYLKNAIEEERYQDAVFVRDNAGAGLVGWWAGVSDDRNDPHGCIIRISAEHGRYVARSYSPRQLATSTAGAPLFEIYVTLNKEGDYRQQAVYLKREAVPETFPSVFPKSPAAPSSMKMSPGGGKTDIFTPVLEDNDDDEDKDDPELADGLSGFQNILQDMIPGVRVKVLKVTAPGKVDRDLISKVVEQIIEEEDEDQDIEAELSSIDTEDTDDDIPGESDEEKDDGEADPTSSDLDNGDNNTKFFHTTAVIRGKTNRIHTLKNEVGEWIEDPFQLQNHVCNHFKNLFCSDNPNLPSTPIQSCDNFVCSTTPTLIELKEALFSIGSLKAPGVDGFHQSHWDLIHSDLLSFISNIFQTKTIPPTSIELHKFNPKKSKPFKNK